MDIVLPHTPQGVYSVPRTLLATTACCKAGTWQWHSARRAPVFKLNVGFPAERHGTTSAYRGASPASAAAISCVS